MKVLLIKVPCLTLRNDRMKDNSTEYLGVNYITAVLRQNGIETEILAYSIKDTNKKELIDLILQKNADIIGFSILYDFAIDDNIAVMSELRKSGCNAQIFAGGHPATFYYKELLSEACNINYICLGEGEYTVLELVKAIETKSDVSNIKGIAYKKDGKIIFNGFRELIHDLDSLPFPVRDELDMALRDTESFETPINISGSRGCSWSRCTFCDIQSFYGLCEGDLWRGRSVKNFVDELEAIYKQYNYRYFNIVDDDFFGPDSNRLSRIKDFVYELKKRKLNLKFDFLCNVRDIDDETLEVVKELGVESMFLGVESGVKRILKTMKKGITPEMSILSINKIESKGLLCKCGSIFLDPYTNLEELKENIEFWHKLNRLSLYSFNKMFIYKGTPIEREMREKGMLIEVEYVIDYQLDKQVENVYDIIQCLKTQVIIPHIIKLKKTVFLLSQKKPFGSNHLIREVTRYINYLSGPSFVEFLNYCVSKIEKEDMLSKDKEVNIYKVKYLQQGELLQKEILMELNKLNNGGANVEKRFYSNIREV